MPNLKTISTNEVDSDSDSEPAMPDLLARLLKIVLTRLAAVRLAERSSRPAT